MSGAQTSTRWISADIAVAHQFASPAELPLVAPLLRAVLENDFVPCHRLAELPGPGHGDAQRLLHVHVLARPGRIHGERHVPMVGRADDHAVNVFAGQHLAEVGDTACRHFLGSGRSPSGRMPRGGSCGNRPRPPTARRPTAGTDDWQSDVPRPPTPMAARFTRLLGALRPKTDAGTIAGNDNAARRGPPQHVAAGKVFGLHGGPPFFDFPIWAPRIQFKRRLPPHVSKAAWSFPGKTANAGRSEN